MSAEPLKVLGMKTLEAVDIEQVTEAEADGPAVGTYELLVRLSDGTRATPMGGSGFKTYEEAKDAIPRVKLDGNFLTVE